MDFEVLETDLLGRIGRLEVKGKSIETPYLFPVVHPIKQQVSTKKIREIGFNGVMTNSYIAYRRARNESVERGIHDLIGFDGLVMTDSGGYQVLEYGEVEISYREIADFQAKIGTDIAVTLDKPTGDTLSRKRAAETVRKSLVDAIKTKKEFGGCGTEWVGPVQGGLFPDLLRKSATELVKAGFRFLALGSPVQIMENYRFSELVRMISEVRNAIPFSIPLHLFGAGHPLTIALAVALGCDTFDSASYILFARQGRYMTESTVLSIENMEYLPCSCEVCIKRSISEIREMERQERTSLVALHNLYILRNELLRTKQAIAEGRLWDLLHERASSHPSLMDAFISVALGASSMVDTTRVVKQRGLFIRSSIDFLRPEIQSSRKMLERCMRVDMKDAVIVPDEATMPLPRSIYSQLSKKFDVYRMHQCLGAYPAELEFTYPFTQTVAASSYFDMEFILSEARKLVGMGYSNVFLLERKGKGYVKKRLTSKQDLKVFSPSALVP